MPSAMVTFPSSALATGGLLERQAVVLAVLLVEFGANLVAGNDPLVLELVEGQIVGGRDGGGFSGLDVLQHGGSRFAVRRQFDRDDRADHFDVVGRGCAGGP